MSYFLIAQILLVQLFVQVVAGPAPSSDEQSGREVRSLHPPARTGALAPHLAPGKARLILSWLEPGEKDGAWRLRYSRFQDGVWSPASLPIVERDDLFVNWADVPSVVELEDGSLLAHWLQKSGAATYAYDVQLARCAPGGEEWIGLGPAHDDGTRTEHGFVQLLPDGEDALGFWLDGRETGGGHGGHDHEEASGSMTLRGARVGRTVREPVLLDERVCDCCRTAAAMTEAGPVIVYRDRTGDEIRDISIVRRTESGWTEPAPVHRDGWQFFGCPVNGPAIAARGQLLAVGWFTVAGDQGDTRLAFSADGGATFGAPISLELDEPSESFGRVDLTFSEEGDALAVWLVGSGTKGRLMLQRVTSAGQRSEALVVTELDAGRISGFPQIERIGAQVLVVWTATVGDGTRLESTLIPADRLAAR